MAGSSPINPSNPPEVGNTSTTSIVETPRPEDSGPLQTTDPTESSLVSLDGKSETKAHWYSAKSAWVFTLVVLAIELVAMPFSDPSPSALGIVFIACNMAMACLAAIWCAVIKSKWSYLIGFSFLFANGVLLSYVSVPNFDPWLILLPLAIAFSISCTLEFVKLLFGRFVIPGRDDGSFQEGLQFSLLHLFIITTVVAILFGIGQRLYPWFAENNEVGNRSILITLATIACVESTNTITAVWAILGKSIWWRICLLIPIAVGTSAAAIFFLGRSQAYIWIALYGISFLVTVVHLSLLRIAGFRFVKRTI